MFALAFCIYFPATHMLLYYCHDLSHMRSIFFSVIAGNMFWFAYAKARSPTMSLMGSIVPMYLRRCGRSAHCNFLVDRACMMASCCCPYFLQASHQCLAVNVVTA